MRLWIRRLSNKIAACFLPNVFGQTLKARFHYERGKDYSLFVFIIFQDVGYVKYVRYTNV